MNNKLIFADKGYLCIPNDNRWFCIAGIWDSPNKGFFINLLGYTIDVSYGESVEDKTKLEWDFTAKKLKRLPTPPADRSVFGS